MRKNYLTFVRTLHGIVDFILPKRPRTIRAEQTSHESLPIRPLTDADPNIPVVSLMEYRERPVEDLIRSLKYDSSGHAARLAARIIVDYLNEELSERELFAQYVVIAPVPLHISRMRERGYDQTKLIVAHISKELGNRAFVSVSEHLLTRTRATKPQTQLPREERLMNVVGAFTCTASDIPKGSLIVLIDDVTTTGATLRAAATAVKTAGFEPFSLALARA